MAPVIQADRVTGGQPPGAYPLDLDQVRRECRALVKRRAALAASVSFIPLPGVDLITDVAVLLKLLPEINTRFGLDDAQIKTLSPARKALAYQLMVGTGGFLAKRITASQMLSMTVQRIGVRLSVMEATRFVPIVGQAAAAGIAFFALNHLANKHIDECAALARQVRDLPDDLTGN
jgi:uncharacterized protein (DUF697 family)